MYGIFTYTYHMLPFKKTNVGTYTIHGSYGIIYMFHSINIYQPCLWISANPPTLLCTFYVSCASDFRPKNKLSNDSWSRPKNRISEVSMTLRVKPIGQKGWFYVCMFSPQTHFFNLAVGFTQTKKHYVVKFDHFPSNPVQIKMVQSTTYLDVPGS